MRETSCDLVLCDLCARRAWRKGQGRGRLECACVNVGNRRHRVPPACIIARVRVWAVHTFERVAAIHAHSLSPHSVVHAHHGLLYTQRRALRRPHTPLSTPHTPDTPQHAPTHQRPRPDQNRRRARTSLDSTATDRSSAPSSGCARRQQPTTGRGPPGQRGITPRRQNRRPGGAPRRDAQQRLSTPLLGPSMHTASHARVPSCIAAAAKWRCS